MWEVWRCPDCGGYCEEVAIDEHKEVCSGSKEQGEKAMQEGRVQERTGGSGRPKRTT